MPWLGMAYIILLFLNTYRRLFLETNTELYISQ